MPLPPRWRLRFDHALDLSAPRLMGIINLTPDSFHAPSRTLDGQAALAVGLAMARDGAAMLDLGAESTRPGAARVDVQTQRSRLAAILEASEQRERLPIPLSVDTTSAAVARYAVERGMHAINDVSAGLDDPDMLRVAAALGCGLVLMHRALPPEADAYSDRYTAPPMTGDVVADVRAFLLARADAAIDAGVEHDRIALDPGFGFGKTVEQNLELVRRIDQITSLGFPVLAGVSRKSFVGRISEPARDTTPQERLPGSIALALALVARGVRLLRVHDVAAHAHALRAWRAAQTRTGAGQ